MTADNESLFGMNPEDRDDLEKQIGEYIAHNKADEGRRRSSAVPPHFASFAELPGYKELTVQRIIGERMGIMDPFFTCHQSAARARTIINNRELLNFATYDYLGLNGHPEIIAAAEEAMRVFGTSAGASRLVAGERPQHAALEKSLASFYGTEAALSFVSGHATNVSTLSTILGPRDAVYHDALAHNSIILGARLSGAARHSYPHNDCEALDRLLRQTRGKYERVIIATEGVFSMDGNIADLPGLIEIKKRHTCFLMMDEAHALGILGATGRGIHEHFGVDSKEVDIWMGTFSKTLCGCGGYIAGCTELIDLLKFKAPGFVYSVGMSPPLAAASAKALELMQREPERTARIQELGAFFLKEAKARGLNTGYAQGVSVVPVIVGNSLTAGHLSAVMFEQGVNVLPIMHPVVEEGMARLRFFLSTWHSEQDIIDVLDILTKELPKAQEKFH